MRQHRSCAYVSTEDGYVKQRSCSPCGTSSRAPLSQFGYRQFHEEFQAGHPIVLAAASCRSTPKRRRRKLRRTVAFIPASLLTNSTPKDNKRCYLAPKMLSCTARGWTALSNGSFEPSYHSFNLVNEIIESFDGVATIVSVSFFQLLCAFG